MQLNFRSLLIDTAHMEKRRNKIIPKGILDDIFKYLHDIYSICRFWVDFFILLVGFSKNSDLYYFYFFFLFFFFYFFFFLFIFFFFFFFFFFAVVAVFWRGCGAGILLIIHLSYICDSSREKGRVGCHIVKFTLSAF